MERTSGRVEIRAGREFRGTILTEGRPATAGRREVFAPGSLRWPPDGIGILLDHYGREEVRAVPRRLPDGRIVVRAPATDALKRAVAAGKRYMSIEFVQARSRVTLGGVREVLSALVRRATVIARPEYDSTAAEIRGPQRIEATVPAGVSMPCACTAKTTGVASIEFGDRAFADIVQKVLEGKATVSAIRRGDDTAFATTATGLRLRVPKSGGLAVAVSGLRSTPAGREIGEQVDAGIDVYVRPVVNFDESEFEVQDDVAIVSTAAMSRILIRPVSGGVAGLDPVRPRPAAEARSPTRRRRLWL